MTPIKLADRMEFVNSDIRGPLFIEANRMEARGEKVTVPESIVKSVTEYTFDPSALGAWRDSLADRIEKLK